MLVFSKDFLCAKTDLNIFKKNIIALKFVRAKIILKLYKITIKLRYITI